MANQGDEACVLAFQIGQWLVAGFGYRFCARLFKMG